MTPIWYATISAIIVTLLASLIPVDGQADRSARHWARKTWRRYRIKLAILQLLATAILASFAQLIGWVPDEDGGILKSLAFGVSWSIAAVAVLRAEVVGFEASTATPGFSLLRAASAHFDGQLSEAVQDSVRLRYANASLEEAQAAAFRANSRWDEPRDDGSPTAAQKAYAATIASYADTPQDLETCRELIVKLVSKYHLTGLG